jgi:hypothetical protein
VYCDETGPDERRVILSVSRTYTEMVTGVATVAEVGGDSTVRVVGLAPITLPCTEPKVTAFLKKSSDAKPEPEMTTEWPPLTDPREAKRELRTRGIVTNAE